MGQQASTPSGKSGKKPKQLQTDAGQLSNAHDSDDDTIPSAQRKSKSPREGKKTTFLKNLLVPSPSPSYSPSPSASPVQGQSPRQSPTPPTAGSKPTISAPFTDDTNNPFLAPLDFIREEERPLQALADSTNFDVGTLRKLQFIFDEISESSIDDGIIDASELTAAMGLDSDCLLARAIFRIFDLTKTKKINFRTWVRTLSALSTKATMEEKIKFSFSLYDLNDDGKIDINELRTLLAAAVRDSVLGLNEEQVQAVCDHTLRDVDRDRNGIVDYNEYREVVSRSRRFVESFTLDIPKLLKSFRVNDKHLTQEEALKKRALWERRKEKTRLKDEENDREDAGVGGADSGAPSQQSSGSEAGTVPSDRSGALGV